MSQSANTILLALVTSDGVSTGMSLMCDKNGITTCLQSFKLVFAYDQTSWTTTRKSCTSRHNISTTTSDKTQTRNDLLP